MRHEKPEYIFTDIVSSHGGTESTKVYSIIHVDDNSVEIAIEHTITERHPINKYEDVMGLYERLTGCNGRRAWTLKEITK